MAPCVSSRKLLARPPGGRGCCRSCNLNEDFNWCMMPKKKNISDVARVTRTRTVRVRLTEDEFAQMSSVMENAGYTTVSAFLRHVITKKRLPDRRDVTAIVDQGILREKMNRLIYEVNRIGVNYNQFVSTYQRQAKLTRADGTPYLNTRLTSEKVSALMRSTEELRDEFAVILAIVKRYIITNN